MLVSFQSGIETAYMIGNEHLSRTFEMRKRVLAVEDEPSSQIMITQSLVKDFVVETAQSLQMARIKLDKNDYDLILLDIGLPDGKGLELLTELQNTRHASVPVILLSLQSDIMTKAYGFELGVYDYIEKPFNPSELLIRVKAHLHRAEALNLNRPSQERVGDLSIDFKAVSVYLYTDIETKALQLSPVEYRILKYFFENHGKACTRESLALSVWKKRHFESRTIDRHISSLRGKIEHCADYIQTIPRIGYRFQVPQEGP